MGWRAIYKDGTELQEGTHGRPVQDGEEGKLLVIAQEDFGHNIAIDLIKGVVAIDYESLEVVDGQIQISNPKCYLWINDDTNVVGDLYFVDQEFLDYRDEDGRKVLDANGRYVKVRNDKLRPLVWRPIWFTRYTNGLPTKVIGAQTTTPPEFGGKNVKKMISILADGRLGID